MRSNIFLYVLCLISSSIFANTDLQNVLDTVNPGTTIYIRAGEYLSKKSYNINEKKDITIVLEDSSKLVVDSSTEVVLEISNCENITIYNGVFKHKIMSEYGDCSAGVIYVNNSSNVNLVNCDINGCGSIGVVADQSKNITAVNCYIHDNSNSAYLFTGGSVEIYLLNNKVENNGFDGDSEFIFNEVEQSEVHQIQLPKNVGRNINRLRSTIKSTFISENSLNHIFIKKDIKLSSELYKSENDFYYYENTWTDPTLMECKEKFLFQIKGQKVLLYSFGFCEATGGYNSFAIGSFYGNSLNTKTFTPLIQDIDEGVIGIDTSRVIYNFTPNRLKIKQTKKINGEMNFSEATLKPLNYGFSEGSRNIRKEPSLLSDILTTSDLTAGEVILLEIGNTERIQNKYDAWLKIDYNGVIGWVYGGLVFN